MKILALDIGQKRIGVAIAEEKITSTYGIIDSSNWEKAIYEISGIVRAEKIEKIIIGIPKNKDNFQSDKIHKFALELTKRITLPIDYVDETLTTQEAERNLRDSKLDPKSKIYKSELDKLAAKQILEQYLSK